MPTASPAADADAWRFRSQPGEPSGKAPRTLAAAVLLPIVARDEQTVLFTERNPNLKRHAGQ
ncbi:MAG: hypothetical protein WDM89_13190 [Rhizomicrobium sp.]